MYLTADYVWKGKNVLTFFRGLILVLLMTCMTVTALAAVYTEGAFWYTVADDSVTITGYFGDEETVWVPASITGLPVNTIGAGAFAGTPAKTVYLPDTVLVVEGGAVDIGTRLVYDAYAAGGSGTQHPEETDPPTSEPTAPTTVPTIAPTEPDWPGNPTRPTTPPTKPGSSGYTGGSTGGNSFGGTVQPTAAASQPVEADIQEGYDQEGTDLPAADRTEPEVPPQSQPVETAASSAEIRMPDAPERSSSGPMIMAVLFALCGFALLVVWYWKRIK